MNICKADVSLAQGIAEVHIYSWRTTYKGIVADTYLSSLSVEKRAAGWTSKLNQLNDDEAVYAALNDEGKVVGFAVGGRCRYKEFPYDGELYAIYLLEEYQRKGIGKQLFMSVVDDLKQDGCTSMMTWVLQGNPAMDFYTSLGGKVFGQEEVEIGEEKHTEFAMGWDTLPGMH
ncbi:GNAT family N-acetyltransferase [Paenibacillus lemnae]|uniref:GNAT family N-acetyltransferase n=1 Tax=Paenibacillus lemnae TaxID=1330551 RepID=A0A848M6U5_PAELE|nr:GNAT family N-acetyltransferase [Paenibacillus lemnae]NMO96435.1 GNAT family N-acetyltransferase [Paenibacillus lemnae]